MSEGLRRFLTAFCLTCLLAFTISGALVAYDRMERTQNGAPEIASGELALGSRAYSFDLSGANDLLARLYAAAERFGGMPLAFSASLKGASEWIAGVLYQTYP